MRFLIIFVLCVLFKSSVGYTVFDMIDQIKNIEEMSEQMVLEALGFGSVRETSDLDDKISDLDFEIIKIQEKIGVDFKTIMQVLYESSTTVVETHLRDISTSVYFLNRSYEDFKKKFDSNRYEISTIKNFANSMVSHSPTSVDFFIQLLFDKTADKEFLDALRFSYDKNSNVLFRNNISALQSMISFFEHLILLNYKSLVMMKSAFTFKRIIKEGNFKQEIIDTSEEFKSRTYKLLNAFQPYMLNASTEIRRCDPERYIEGETYIQLKNFLHGYILSKENIDTSGYCSDECEEYSYNDIKSLKCNENRWCKSQAACTKIVDCKYVDVSMEICTNDTTVSTRRYNYIKFSNGETYGNIRACPINQLEKLETYRQLLIYKCSYCFCICDEGLKPYSERYINLRKITSNLTANMVVTGVRFVKLNKIIHLQIQQGKLLPNGEIDNNSIEWIPCENYSVINKKYTKGKDYHVLTWETRAFDFADIKADENSVITGVKFTLIGSRIHLEIQTTPFNFTSGKLESNKSKIKSDPDLAIKHKFAREMKLHEPDIPIKTETSPKITTNKFIQFTHSDDKKDAAQTTVPFFDAQEVVSSIPTPLSGIGIFHKGKRGYGGFIAPRIFTYNFATFLKPIFQNETNKTRL